MIRKVMLPAVILLLVSTGTILADPIRVPEDYQSIQDAIDHATTPGCTISVWGPPPGQPPDPPYIYYENITCNKNLFIVNRSFLPGQVPDPPSWDWVIIDCSSGNQPDSPVVRVYTGAEPLEVTIKGFTIRNGGGDAGGGIKCIGAQRIRIDSNYIHSCKVLESGGGGIYILNANQVEIISNLIENNDPDKGGLLKTVGNIANPDIVAEKPGGNRHRLW